MTTNDSGKSSINASGPTVPSGIYRTSGGGRNDYVFVWAQNQAMWEALVRAMGRVELLEDPRCATPESRVD
ncbi:MAG: CoA transferase, partial [Pirellulaceae bacterium]|nr:CoA transferase [Pirellulaceae bacterium]